MPMKNAANANRNHRKIFLASAVFASGAIVSADSCSGFSQSSGGVILSCDKARRGCSFIFPESEREYIARRRRSIFSFSCSEESIPAIIPDFRWRLVLGLKDAFPKLLGLSCVIAGRALHLPRANSLLYKLYA